MVRQGFPCVYWFLVKCGSYIVLCESLTRISYASCFSVNRRNSGKSIQGKQCLWWSRYSIEDHGGFIVVRLLLLMRAASEANGYAMQRLWSRIYLRLWCASLSGFMLVHWYIYQTTLFSVECMCPYFDILKCPFSWFKLASILPM